MNELHLFAGGGGGILGGMLLGHTCVCAVEIEPYCRRILLQRQRDGILPRFPIWDDVRTFDGRPWRGLVDVVCGGFPCQDISSAGKGAGIEGRSSGLWSEMARIIREVRPTYAFVENSPVLTSRGLHRVLGDLAEMGFNAKWGVLGAADAIWLSGTPCFDHERLRCFITAAHSDRLRKLQPQGSEQDQRRRTSYSDQENAFSLRNRLKQMEQSEPRRTKGQESTSATEYGALASRRGWWSDEPAVGRVADGVAYRVDRIRALGNGQVPAVVKLAWETLTAAGGCPCSYMRTRPCYYIATERGKRGINGT